MSDENVNPAPSEEKAIETKPKITLREALDKFDMDYHILRLLRNEPFFAAISSHVDKTPSLNLPTAGVRITSEGHYEMLYNPLFFADLPDKQKTGVLKHEFYHLVLEHVSSRLPVEGMTKMWNIATDLAINTMIPDEIPEIGCIPGQKMFANYPANKSSEWYMARLQEDKDKGNDKSESNDSFDDHSEWGENSENLDPSVKEIAKQRLKEIMKDAADQANKRNSWGTVSAAMRQDIMKRLATKVNWRSVLRYFIKTSQRSDRTSTVRKLNKRFPYIHAGKKVQRHANIAISIDQSGSVSDELLSKFFSELNVLSGIATFTVVPFDSHVDTSKVYTWKKGMHRNAERVLCGGTDFDAPTDYVNERNFDGHIILTDMYAPKPKPSKCQRMWMTDDNGSSNPYFTTNERVICVD